MVALFLWQFHYSRKHKGFSPLFATIIAQASYKGKKKFVNILEMDSVVNRLFRFSVLKNLTEKWVGLVNFPHFPPTFFG